MLETIRRQTFALPSAISDVLRVRDEATRTLDSADSHVYDSFGDAFNQLANSLGVSQSHPCSFYTSEGRVDVRIEGEISIFEFQPEGGERHYIHVDSEGRIQKNSFDDEDGHGEWIPRGQQAIDCLTMVLRNVSGGGR